MGIIETHQRYAIFVVLDLKCRSAYRQDSSQLASKILDLSLSLGSNGMFEYSLRQTSYKMEDRGYSSAISSKKEVLALYSIHCGENGPQFQCSNSLRDIERAVFHAQ